MNAEHVRQIPQKFEAN